MNRKDFLKKLMLGIGASLFVPKFLFSETNTHQPSFDGPNKIIDSKWHDFKITDKITIPCDLQEFADEFSKKFKKLSHGNGIPTTYFSNNGKFRIDYHTKLRDTRTRRYLSTFSRINNETGVIEINKEALDRIKATENFVFYGIIWCYIKRMAYGMKIYHDSGVDILTTQYYLTTKRPIKDILIGWSGQFKESTTDHNLKRYKILSDYINSYHKNKFA